VSDFSDLWPSAGTPVPKAGDPLREKTVPLIRNALAKTPLRGMEVTGWDFALLLNPAGGIMAGVAIAVKGVDLLGPNKELCTFQPLPTWAADQAAVDETVAQLISNMYQFRESQKNPQQQQPGRSGLIEARIGFGPDGRPLQ
jgi:hypothetical protein